MNPRAEFSPVMAMFPKWHPVVTSQVLRSVGGDELHRASKFPFWGTLVGSAIYHPQ